MPMSERLWYYAVDGRQEGPVPESALQQLFQSQRLRPETLVWAETMKDWMCASSVEGLLPPGSHLPPAPPIAMPVAAAFAGYAGFWKRFAACLIDGFVLMVAGFVVGFIFGMVYGAATGSVEGAEAIGNLIGVVMGWLYSALLESSPRQATLGKMALGIKVTDVDGNPISFAKATGRHFGKILSVLTLFVGFIMVGITERKQGLHDMMAGCLVVNA
ncbi:MAG: RDD family protein [Lentisphaerae bacterium]|nr:RDD family protein [Lentisphaerota bacterium]